MAVVGTADVIVRAITDDFKNDIEKALKDIKPSTNKVGNDIGRDFHRSVTRGMGSGNKSAFAKIEKEAEAARKKLNGLIRTGYFVGPAIGGAASAIGDLAMGLVALGGAVGAAAPALGVLPGLLAAVAQGALTAKLAFGGVVKGIGALLKQKTGKTSGGGDAARDAAIEDARRRLALVYQGAAEKMAAANDKVRKAQIALNQAYNDGIESLQQLGFNAEEAALAEKKAAIELERARETLLRTQDVPPNSRMRREAEIAFKEADLNYRQAKDKANDLAKAQEYAAQTGIEGTSEVIKAKQDLNEAEADRIKTERDNAQDILQAQLALQKAMQKTNQNSANSVDLLKDLSAEARRFALYIASLKPEFLKLRGAAGENLFGPLTVAVNMIVTKLFPVLIPIVRTMGGVIGNLARRFAEMLTRVDNLDIFKRVFGGANIVIMRNIGHAIVDAAEGALNLLDAISPLTVRFSEFVKKTADAWVGTLRFKNATGELTDKFERAAVFAKGIGDLFVSIFQAFKAFGGGASVAGLRIIEALTGAFNKMKAFLDEASRTGELQQHFMRVADNIIAIGGLLGGVAKMFYELSGSTGVKAFAEALMPITGIFTEIFRQMTTTGPLFGTFLVQVANLLKAFTDTGGIQMFFTIINKALEVIVKIFSNDIVRQIFLVLAAVKGITLAFGALYTALRFAGLGMLGNIFGANGLSASLGRTSLSARKAAIELRAMRIAGLGFGSGLMSSLRGATQNFALLGKEILKTTMFTLKNTAAAIGNGISWLFSSASLKAFGRALKFATVGVYQMTRALIAQAIAFAMTPVGAAVVAIAALVAVFVLAYTKSENLRKAISEMGKAIMGSLGQAFKTIKDAIGGAMPSFKNFSDVMKKLGDWIAKYIIPVFTKVIQFGIKLFTVYLLVLINSVKAAIAFFRIIFELFMIFPRAVANAGKSGEDFGTGLVSAIKTAAINIANIIIDLVNNVIRAFNVLSPKDIPLIPLLEDSKKATDNLSTASAGLTDHQEEVRRQMEMMGEQAKNLYKDFGSLEKIQADVRNALETTFDTVTSSARGYINARDAAKAFKDETKNLATTMKDSSLSDDQKTDALYAYSGSVLDAIKKNIELGGTQESTTEIMKKGRDAFIENAKKAGIFGDKAEQLANKLGLTPNTIKKTFVASGLGDLQEMTKELGKLEQLGKTANAREGRGTFSSTRLVQLKAEISTKMFGRGQTEKQPLYVEVTNQGKAVGGPVSANKTYLVGENGPELFTSNSAGNITPNGQLSQAGVGSAPIINVHPSQGMDEIELSHLVSRQLAWQMKRGV